MCHYCGCRHISVIDELMTEHETQMRLADDLAAAAVRGEDALARRRLAELNQALDRHFRKEEAGLFAMLRLDEPDNAAYDEHLSAITEAHYKIRREVAAIDLDSGTWATSALEAISDLGAVIVREEYGVFPAALATLSALQWDALADRSIAGAANA